LISPIVSGGGPPSRQVPLKTKNSAERSRGNQGRFSRWEPRGRRPTNQTKMLQGSVVPDPKDGRGDDRCMGNVFSGKVWEPTPMDKRG